MNGQAASKSDDSKTFCENSLTPLRVAIVNHLLRHILKIPENTGYVTTILEQLSKYKRLLACCLMMKCLSS